MADATLARSDFYVYVLFRHDTGQPFYVGKGRRDRVERHFSDLRNPHKSHIIARAKKVGCDIPRVKIAVGMTERQAFDVEIAFIDAIGREPNGPLVNLTDGGDGPSGGTWKLSEATIEKQNLAKRSRHGSFVGRKHSEETLAKMRATAAARDCRHSPETRAKMSASGRLKKLTAEHRANIGKGLKGNNNAIAKRLRECQLLTSPKS
jgi:hypothetical protein